MTTLHISNPFNADSRVRFRNPTWTLTNVDPNSVSECAVMQATVENIIISSEHSTVCRAAVGDKSFVVKFCLDQRFQADLDREARAYQEDLASLQGKIIPRFKGYFKYPPPDSCLGPYSCLMLENCGQSVFAFQRLPEEDKIQILNLLGTMHKHGFHPPDFAPSNVVGRDHTYRLIDFHLLEPHRCDWHEGFDWRRGQIMPTVGTFSCPFLFYAARDMRFWRYPTFKPMLNIAGVNYAPTKDFPPQHIIDRLVPKDFMLFETNQSLLVDWLKRLKSKMDADPNVSGDELVNEHMKSLPDFPITRKKMRFGRRKHADPA